MCNCKNKPSLNRNALSFRTDNGQNSSGLTKFNTSDFVVQYFTGETGGYIGKVTNINYGNRIKNSQVLVHKDDIEQDPNSFSNSPIKVEEVQEVEVSHKEEILFTPTRKGKSKVSELKEETVETVVEETKEFVVFEEIQIPETLEQKVENTDEI